MDGSANRRGVEIATTIAGWLIENCGAWEQGRPSMIKRKRTAPKLHSFRRNLKWTWADLKKDLVSGDGLLVSMVRYRLAVLLVIILMAIAKFGFGWF